MTATTTLSEQQQQILTFERGHWNHAGNKDQAIRDTFGVTPPRYYQQLLALIARPEALEAHPVLVKRLRRRLTRT